MKAVNIAQFRAHFSEYLSDVERGEEVQVCKRNKAVARVVRIQNDKPRNRTRLGSARGTIKVLGSLTDPAVDLEDWEMLR